MYTPYRTVTDEQLETAGMIFAVYPPEPGRPATTGRRVVLFDTRAPKGVPAVQLGTVTMLGIALDAADPEGQLDLLRRRIAHVKPPPE